MNTNTNLDDREAEMWPGHQVRLMCQAFTMIELLVVVSILAILVAMLFPAIGMVRQGAYASSCLKNLGQVHAGMSAYVLDWSVLPSAAGPYNRPWPHAVAATYLESSGGGGNSAKDVLKCPADRRIVGGMGGFSDTTNYMQATWMNNGEEQYGEWVILWSSYAFNTRVFTGSFDPNDPPVLQFASSKVGMFWDSWRFSTSGWVNPGQLGDIPGVNRHKRGVNMVYGDGHAAYLDMAPMDHGQFWSIVPWATDYMWGSTRCINAAFSPGPFDSDQAPWKDI